MRQVSAWFSLTENRRIKINTLKHINGGFLSWLGTFSSLVSLCYVLQYRVMENIVIFLRVNKRFLKDTYLFPSGYYWLGWVFSISCFLIQFSLSLFCNGLGFIVDKLYLIFCLLIVFVFDAVIFIMRNK